MIVFAPLILAAALHAAPSSGAAAVLHKMAAANSWVKTYKVRIHFDAKVHSFVSLPLQLNATLYYKQPDKMQIVFDSVPSLAKQFQNFYASTGTPQTWPKTYVVTLEPSDSPDTNTVTLRLRPRSDSNLDYALMTVDTTSYGVITQQWMYKDGSNINVSQSNESGPKYVLPDRQEGDFHFPRYRAHVIADYDEYDINVPIPDSVFNKQTQQ
ncbi:MAG: hypothetical protein JO219_01800, partial [Candidatus Eremiobacteraeota bacterium]|nr:hypothetical protein [Candidatus Eremiobacteraeota bacterium]